MTLEQVFTDRLTLVTHILEQVKQDLSQYGINIIKVLITDIAMDPQVSQSLKLKKRNLLQKQATEKKELGNKVRDIKIAEAQRDAKRHAGQGLALMRKAMANGFKESVTSVADTGVGTDKAMHMMVATQYLDTLKDFALSGRASIMVPTGPSGITEIERQVR